MESHSLTHLAPAVLESEVIARASRIRVSIAELLPYLAEFDDRKLYRPAGYSSMSAYCVGKLEMSDDEASKRIYAARAARQFPAIFQAIADGRLNLSAVLLLAPHLAVETADELVAAAAHKTRAELQALLAERFPKPDLETRLEAAPVTTCSSQHAPGHVEPSAARPKLAPLSPERFALQVTVSKATHDKLRRAQSLLGHAVPAGDLAQVLDRALDALLHQLERRKLAATDRPGKPRRTTSPRHVPAPVRRAVWLRDGARCTFVSEDGHRCEETRGVEIDHIVPVARGGQSTVENVRLRCRAHNQYEAEQAFGVGFMQEKRETARRLAEETRRRSAAGGERARQQAITEAEVDPDRSVVPWLQALGLKPEDARRAAAVADAAPDASLEERVRIALRSVAPVGARRVMRLA